jgi:hypothetical protein
METARFSETLVSTCESTWRLNPEQQQEQRCLLHRRENLKLLLCVGEQEHFAEEIIRQNLFYVTHVLYGWLT